jgi:hypothetical protein
MRIPLRNSLAIVPLPVPLLGTSTLGTLAVVNGESKMGWDHGSE